ncbi:hypothetical protein ACWGH4_05905 [Streptomyces sp. NPDC054847]
MSGRKAGLLAALATTALFGTALGAPAQAAQAANDVTLIEMDAQESYFARPDGTDVNNRFQTILAVRQPGGGEERDAKNVVAVYDASALKGKVTLSGLGHRCTRQDHVVTCPQGDFYERTYVTPFRIKAVAGAEIGEAGPIKVTVTSDNAGTLTRSTRVFIGEHQPVYRAHAPYTVPESERGSLPAITPAFGNAGQVEMPTGVVMRVAVGDALDFTGERYSNCHYGKAVAHCEFPGPLMPGTAYETDGDFDAVTETKRRVKGAYGYSVRPVGNLLEYTDYRREPRGNGRVLGLKPVDIGTLSPGGGQLPFVTEGEWTTDWSFRDGDTPGDASGVTLEGAVGSYAEVELPVARNLGPDNAGNTYVRQAVVTLPEGVSLATPEPGSHPSEIGYCDAGRSADEPIRCGLNNYSNVLRVHIDRKPEQGRPGTLTLVLPDGVNDPDLSNNTVPVRLEVTGDASPSASPSPAPSASPGPNPSPSASAAPATGAGPSAAAGSPNGKLASTGTSAVVLIGTASAVAVALGAALLLRRRRA